jgi:urease accessory protein
MTSAARGLVLSIAALAIAAPAEAHTFGAAGAGLAQGLVHPFAGLDHLLAMVAIGLWAAQQGGRALWLVPASFVLVMAVGGALALAGIDVPLVEPAIALSVLVLGLAVAAGLRVPMAAGMALAGAFALFHGHAHGAELPMAATPWAYALGFLAATAALHGIGLAIGRMLTSPAGARLVRFGGAGIAAAGLVFLVA